MKHKIFIDGQEGTTGLQLMDRLTARPDIELLEIDPELRKDSTARQAMLNEAEVAFLCLPDAAAIEAVALAQNKDTIIIDASTAHRTAPGWVYGLPELSPAQHEAVKISKRIGNPGCHATGMLSIVAPLVAAGIMSADYPVTVHSITGYSGGGKKMIAQYEDAQRPDSYISPRQYGLTLKHKHLPEMQAVAGLAVAPIFNPIVCDFYAGMAVSIPIFTSMLTKKMDVAAMTEFFVDHYMGASFIGVADPPEDGFLPATLNTGTNKLTLYVCGNADQLTVVSVFDNLGKGASGAAVQNMNIALGLEDNAYLV